MELTHSFTVPTSVDEAWSLFMDLERVGACFPGATVTDVSQDDFSGTVKVKVGPISLLYTGSGSFVAKDDEGHRAVIEAKGKDKRGNGTAGATVTIQLTPDGGGARADVVTDLAVTGKPAQFGRGVMQDVSDKLLGQFIACIETHLGGEQAAGAELVSEPTVATATAPRAPVREATVPEAVVREAAAAPSPAVEAGDDALDLGSAVLPVLIQRYAGYAVSAAIGVVVGWLIGRRRSAR